jgi:CBS domain-containing protein
MSRPTLEQSMTRHPHSIRAGETLRTAEKMMERLGVHHLPVRDGGALVGVITDSDVAFAARVRGDIDQVRVEEACTDSPVTVDIETDLHLALGLLMEKRVDSLLVTDSEDGGEPALVGIFTLRDAARVLWERTRD